MTTKTTTTTNKTYTYTYSPGSESKPTLLFLHGFPSTRQTWHFQITHFMEQGYGIIAPDLLGFGDSSKPRDLDAYRLKPMTADIVSILDQEGVGKVHAIGHDIGCSVLSRLVDYHPDRVLSASFLVVPYTPPGMEFNLEKVNELCRGVLGREKFGYISFLAAEGSEGVVERFSESLLSLFYPHDPDLWINHLGPTGSIEKWLLSDTRAPLAPYISKQEFQALNAQFTGSSLNWYKALVRNINIPDEITSQPPLKGKIDVPVLMICPEEMDFPVDGIRDVAADVMVRTCSTRGHWVQLERADEVNGFLGEFFDSL
ncbi:Alpha/Beta hydrolase protein [Aspergillus avenaceus]|uniref:Alpha/Beta hydrolase protein n=1 Tax=Aspergillus avenaceus TaxID=36643 RepID=A0A5N6TS76_ASPAV|nr:Alpha/Beta hydrolase protein [Aspergillus avenaceus]